MSAGLRMLAIAAAVGILSIAAAEEPKVAGPSGPSGAAVHHKLGGGFRGHGLEGAAEPATPAGASGASGSIGESGPSGPTPSPRSTPKPILINNKTIGTTPQPRNTGAEKAPPSEPVSAAPPAPPLAPPVDLQGHDEKYWRDRAAGAKDRLEKAKQGIVSAQTEEHRLENDFYAWDDGQYRERVIRPAWEKSKEDLEAAKSELAAAQKAIEVLPDEARRAGALPGWIR